MMLTYAGLITGENWDGLKEYFRTFDWLIAGIIVVLGTWWIWRHIKLLKREA